MSGFKHNHEFRIRPYDSDNVENAWCIVTKDNNGFDITPCVDLTEELAEWMCAALNVGIGLEKLWAHHNNPDTLNALAGHDPAAVVVIDREKWEALVKACEYSIEQSQYIDEAIGYADCGDKLEAALRDLKGEGE